MSLGFDIPLTRAISVYVVPYRRAIRYSVSPERTTWVARHVEGGAVVAGIGVTVVTGVTGMAVGIGVGAGVVNWALQIGPVVIFVQGTLGIVSF